MSPIKDIKKTLAPVVSNKDGNEIIAPSATKSPSRPVAPMTNSKMKSPR